MSIYHDIDEIKAMALHYARKFNCNYNVILHSPDKEGNFSLLAGSTYEFVSDSYFNKERPNVIILHRTDDLKNGN